LSNSIDNGNYTQLVSDASVPGLDSNLLHSRRPLSSLVLQPKALTAGFNCKLAALLLLTASAAHAAQTDVTIGMQLEPPNLDPTGGAAAAIDEVVYANIFEGLTRFGADGSINPALAESWEISDDGKTYTFSLRTGVTYHDGSAFDANDVKFSLDRARAEDSTNAQKALFSGIESVEVVDEATVKIQLTNPDGNLAFNLAWGDAVIVAEETIDAAKTSPIGTGPFFRLGAGR